MKTNDMYSIGEVEKICDIPIKTLRYYDSIKLVIPKFRDEESNYRYYSKDQIVTIYIIRKLRMLGFALKEINEIVHNNNAHKLEECVDQKLNDLATEIKKLQKRYSDGCDFVQRLRKGVDFISTYTTENSIPKNIIIEDIPETDIVFTRKVMKTYANKDVSLERWVEIFNLCNNLNLKNKGSVIITYHSNPLDQFLYKDLDTEFGICIESPYDGPNCKKFGGFTAATSIHVGDYANIIQTHIDMIQFLNKNGYKIDGDICEEFIISPFDVNNPDNHVTKVIIPVIKD